MGAFHTLALAFAPRLVQYVLLRDEGRGTDLPAPGAAEVRPVHAARPQALSCHWERAGDGALVAHWVADNEKDVPPESPEGFACELLREIPRRLIDAADRFERRGSVSALIAVSRMARMNHSKRALRLVMEDDPHK